MSDTSDTLIMTTRAGNETYADARGYSLILYGPSQTAVVLSRKQGKLCDLNASSADQKIIEQTRPLEPSLWQQVTGEIPFTAPHNFLPGLCGSTPEETETITVKRPFFRSRPTTLSDEKGNRIELPTAYDKRGAPAQVKDVSGKTLCEIDKKLALALDTAPPLDRLRNQTELRSYQFEATPGAIPNLCKDTRQK